MNVLSSIPKTYTATALNSVFKLTITLNYKEMYYLNVDRSNSEIDGLYQHGIVLEKTAIEGGNPGPKRAGGQHAR